MEIVIKIDEKIYNHTQKYEVGGFNRENDTKLFMAIKNGTPLQKGHGRLFDERDIVNGNYEVIGNRIYELEPIIEADKAESEDKE